MSFPRYPQYKDSGVEWLGEVPAHWTVVELKHIADVNTGMAKGKDHAGRSTIAVPYLRVANVQNGYLDLDDVALMEIPVADLARYSLKPGDVLMNEGGDFDKLGRGCVWNGQIDPCITQNHVFAVRPRGVRSEWLSAITGSGYAQFYFKTRAKQSTNLASISSTNLMELPVVLPPPEEQTAIVTFLERETAKIDALVAEQQRLIVLLKEKRQAIISHAVTQGLSPNVPKKPSNVEWLGEVPAHWKIRRVSSLSTKITNGYVGPTRDIFVDDGIRYLQSLHIKDNKIRFDVPYFVSAEWSRQHSKSILEAGDVLVVQTGDIGQAAVVTDEFAGCNCHALIIVSPVREVVEGAWIALVMKAEYGLQSLLSIQTGALHPHLNCGDVKDVSIPLPPLVEQRQIIEKVGEQTRSLDALILEAERAIELLQERRAALISAAVTGQIDVRAIANRAAA
ncbi:MAG TPA: restriction endonuclease subunit S [Archangium sp.]|uniref:restriction endonuclease subunit S n=1 Tax=Archangium sp. TaxID=1872627 RepID=UPI002E35FB4D|nr:restriction endonuclease subunit S [Archangium sp.]HEX5744601.1 restriction endonuclease subunit S [Archangium sp.]